MSTAGVPEARGGAAPLTSPENLSYLRRHNICERLEVLVRHLMERRPADPLAALCDLAAATRTEPAPSGPGAASVLAPVALNLVSPPPPMAPSSASRPSAISPTNGRQRGFALGPPAAKLPAPPAAPVPASYSARRFGSEASASPGGASAAGARLGSRMGSAALLRSADGKADARDDSARSEASGFSALSVASVDMGDFLADCRVALATVPPAAAPRLAPGETGGGTAGGIAGERLVSLGELSEVVDRVALPLPDGRLLADLFAEMDHAGAGVVPFEAVLARMAHRIQGRYPSECLRRLFNALAPGRALDAQAEAAAAIALPPAVFTAAEDAAMGDNTMGGGPMTPLYGSSRASSACVLGSFPGGRPAAFGARTVGDGAAAAGAVFAVTVPVAVCLDVGLRRGLGLRLSLRDLDDLLLRLASPRQPDGSVTLHLLDFSRLAHLATVEFGGAAGSVEAGAGADWRSYGSPIAADHLPAVWTA